MTPWVRQPSAGLHVLARSTADGIRVDWHEEVPPDDVAAARDGLRAYLAFAGRVELGLGRPRVLPARHPHAGELVVAGHPDEHRFLEVHMGRGEPFTTHVEPSAAERAAGAPVHGPVDAPHLSIDPHVYRVTSSSFGPYRPGGGADGPALPLARLVEALRAELDHRSA